jgi:hypothetical protein
VLKPVHRYCKMPSFAFCARSVYLILKLPAFRNAPAADARGNERVNSGTIGSHGILIGLQ